MILVIIKTLDSLYFFCAITYIFKDVQTVIAILNVKSHVCVSDIVCYIPLYIIWWLLYRCNDIIGISSTLVHKKKLTYLNNKRFLVTHIPLMSWQCNMLYFLMSTTLQHFGLLSTNCWKTICLYDLCLSVGWFVPSNTDRSRWIIYDLLAA